MKTAATQPKTKQQPPQAQAPAQNGRIEYVVLQPITWHGKSYLQNQIVDFAAKGSHANRDRWLAAGKIKPLADMQNMLGMQKKLHTTDGKGPAAGDAKLTELCHLVLKPFLWKNEPKEPGDRIVEKIPGASVLVHNLEQEGKIRPLTIEELSPKKGRAKLAAAAAKVAQPTDGKAADPGTFQMTDLALLDPPRWNPRQDFESVGAREDFAGLVQSVREQGIIEPLIIRPRPEGRFEVVAGERRRRAAKEAGLAAVPAIVRQLDDLAALRIQAIENLQRRDINPLEECEGYRRLMDRGGYSVADLVRETGKSEASIYARLVLAKAPPGIRKALQEGKIPASTAELVARIDDVSFQGVAMDAILFPEHGEAEDGAEVLSFRQAKAWIAARRERAKQEEEWGKAARGSHVAKQEGVRVLTVEQSNEAIYGGGYVKNREHFLKPEDHCYTDPENRTFAEIVKAAGRELPAPVIARDPDKGSPVVLLDRKATEAAIADLVPNAEEQQRRRQEAEDLRKKEWQEADAIRRQHAVDLAARAKSIEALCQARDEWDSQRDEAFARFLVRRMIEERIMDNAEDLAEVLTANGCPCDKKEADGFDGAWLTDYLAGCDLGKLRRWQMYFALRGEYDVSFVEEEALDRAEEIFEPTRI